MSYKLEVSEEERQMILLALHKLKLQRPGWAFALQPIEAQLGGQLQWPDE